MSLGLHSAHQEKVCSLSSRNGTCGREPRPFHRCDRRMLAGGSVDLDAPEIHSGNPLDARLAFDEAEELRCVWPPLAVDRHIVGGTGPDWALRTCRAKAVNNGLVPTSAARSGKARIQVRFPWYPVLSCSRESSALAAAAGCGASFGFG